MAEEAKSGSRAASHSSGDGNGNGERAEDGERASGASADRPEQKISAPSLGPNTVIEHEPVEERLARHEQSEVDAMGRDKRRPVVGQSYGPSKARQLGLYGIFLAVAAALVIGGIILIGKLDTPVGKHVPCSAPWCKGDPKQIKPKPIQ
jgi:hypothetical protein